MSQNFYSILHVFSLLLLSGFTFSAFAAPTPERRRKSAILTGSLSLLVLVGGFGLLARLGIGWEPWVIIKLVCWLGISAMAGMAFKRAHLVGNLRWLTIAFLAVAVLMIYWGRNQSALKSWPGAEDSTPPAVDTGLPN